MKGTLYRIWDKLLCAVFPRRCPYCGTVLSPQEYCCADCLQNLPKIEQPICPLCGHSKKDCACKKKKGYYSAVTAPFYYEGTILKAVHRLKFENKDFVAETFAKDMAEAVRLSFPVEDIDLIAFVPFSKKQKRERLYNPSEVLARALSKELSIPCEAVLFKLFETKTQHNLKGSERSGNVLGVYEVEETADIADEIVLLVDDIKTTGATLSECAKMLKLRGAKGVYAVTFAITKHTRKSAKKNA